MHAPSHMPNAVTYAGWTRLSFGLSGRGPKELHRVAAKQLAATAATAAGVSASDNATRRRTFGQNLVDIKVDGLGAILAAAVTTPFFFFQLFSTVVWLVGEWHAQHGCACTCDCVQC
jgi:hypothetical protein